MEHRETEHAEPEFDAFLVRMRPEPDPAWVSELEDKLLPHRAARIARWRLPHVRVGAAFAAALATLLIILSLAGVGPFGGEPTSVRAKDNCEYVPVSRVERVPTVVQGPGEQPTVGSRLQRVQRFERRCR